MEERTGRDLMYIIIILVLLVAFFTVLIESKSYSRSLHKFYISEMNRLGCLYSPVLYPEFIGVNPEELINKSAVYIEGLE